MIKLIASDIDGTLLQDGETAISQRFFTQARRLMEQGVAVCAASGRQYTSLDTAAVILDWTLGEAYRQVMERGKFLKGRVKE